MPDERIQFVVWGDPVPQGSWKAFITRTREGLRATAIPSNKAALNHWRDHIAETARTHMVGRAPIDEPVRILLVAAMPLKGAQPRSRFWRFPIRKHRDPDADKLCRAVLDGLTDVVLSDDAIVVDLQIRKRYAGRADSLPEPGMRIVVEPMEPEALDL